MTFEIRGNQFVKDRKPVKLISGAVHYFRNMPDNWTDIFKKMKALGCNCAETYCAWSLHEKQPGVFDFADNLNISEFIKAAGEGAYGNSPSRPVYLCRMGIRRASVVDTDRAKYGNPLLEQGIHTVFRQVSRQTV